MGMDEFEDESDDEGWYFSVLSNVLLILGSYIY